MTEQHPITPPPELVRKWQIEIEYCSKRADREALVAKVFQLGANYELEACCEWLNREVGTGWGHGTKLRAARRPKPLSLKEQALEALKHAEEGWRPVPTDCAIIRRALESLPD